MSCFFKANKYCDVHNKPITAERSAPCVNEIRYNGDYGPTHKRIKSANSNRISVNVLQHQARLDAN